jgi:hypothetical protein
MSSEHNSSSLKNNLIGVLMSSSFLEKILLLLVTAMLSGIIIPVIATRIQRLNTMSDLQLEAEKRLFDDFTRVVIKYETLILDVSYYGQPGMENPRLQQLALNKYFDQSTDLLADWRVQAVRANQLCGPAVAQKITKFQALMFEKQDMPMMKLSSDSTKNSQEWGRLHKLNIEMYEKAEQLVIELAKDIRISSNANTWKLTEFKKSM